MARRLSEVEAALKEERKQAAQWYKKHEGELEPTAEERYGPLRARVRTSGSVHDRLVFLGLIRDQEPRYDEGGRFVPLLSRPKVIDMQEAALAAQVEHVLSFLKPAQVTLLMSYYVEGLTWQELQQGSASKQAFYQRLAWARKAFLKAWLKHGEDDITLGEEVF